MTRLQPDMLQNDPNYELLLVIEHSNLMPFLENYLFSKHRLMRMFWAYNILLFVALVIFAYNDIRNGHIGWTTLLQQFGWGIFLLFTVGIVIHEGIHGLAYKLCGAPKVNFGVNWKRLYFYAIADRFVIDRRQFIFVALAPFVVITLVTIIGILFSDVETRWVLWSVLFFHTNACAGDFAILTFYAQYQTFPNLLTYDDQSDGKSYFYLKRTHA